jgi:ABC-2 type transport system permease protein
VSTPGLGAAREAGAIHDIGYRRYDGPRLGPTYIERSLFVSSLRGTFGFGRSARSKVMPILLFVVMVLPALIIAAIVNITHANELPLEYPSYPIRLSVVVSLFVAAQSPQSVSRDLRYRVVALYFSRPLSRRGYVQAKLAAMSSALFVVMATPLLVLYAGAILAGLSFWDNTRGVLAGLAGAAIFAIVLASLGLLIAAWTPRRGIGVAAVVAVVLILSGVSAIVQGVAKDQGAETLAGWAGLISPFGLVDGVQVWALNAESSTVIGPPGSAGGPGFALVTIAVVAACYLLLVRRYRSVTVA